MVNFTKAGSTTRTADRLRRTSFWFRWVGATLVGLVVGFMGSLAAVDAIVGPEGPEAFGVPFEVAFPVVIGVTGAVAGTFQWLVIRRRVPLGPAWIPATASGLLVATLVVVQLPEGTTLPSALAWGATHALVLAVAVGSLQWLAIRDTDPTRRWLWASLGGWVAAGIAGDAVAWYTDGGVGIMVIFVLWAALTAPVLHRLLTGTRSPALSPTASSAASTIGR